MVIWNNSNAKKSLRVVLGAKRRLGCYFKVTSREMRDSIFTIQVAATFFCLPLYQINKLTAADADLYRCSVVNEYGEAFCVVGLRIIQGRIGGSCVKTKWLFHAF